MVKEILRENFEMLSKIGIFSIEEVRVSDKKQGKTIIIKKPVRLARDQDIKDRHEQYDDDSAEKLVKRACMRRLQMIYSIVTREAKKRNRQDLLIGNDLERDEVKEDLTKLFDYCYGVARELEIFVPHDRNYYSTLTDHEGVEMCDKVIPEELADKGWEGMDKGKRKQNTNVTDEGGDEEK